MIQILGLRDHVDKTGKVKKRQAFYERKWRIPSIDKVFMETNDFLAPIPEKDRENLYFTVANCFEGPEARKIQEQWAMPFDIDNLGLETTVESEIRKHCNRIVEVSCQELGVDFTKVSSVFSGNGVQFFVMLEQPIMNAEFFDTMREHYRLVCAKIQRRLTKENIAGKVDTSVFDAARLMRLPNTWNIKPKTGKKWAFVVHGNLQPQRFDLQEVIGDTEVRRADTMSKTQWKSFLNAPDSATILSTCEFLKFCKDKPNDVSEEQWYAMLGITAFLPNGDEISHQYSEAYMGYDQQETQDKIDQARRAAGPRSCKDIGSRWDGCRNCEHYNVVTHPVLIKGEDYIPTKTTGFRKVNLDKYGRPQPGVVVIEDLVKHYLTEFEYVKIAGNGTYRYSPEGKKWEDYHPDFLRKWVWDTVVPVRPSSKDTDEFIDRLNAVNVQPMRWLNVPDSRYVNFSNGVLDRTTKELLPHSSKYAFKYVLPFEYNPRATAPLFEKFLDEITCDRAELKQLLKEFGGYCLSGAEYKYQYALVLLGDGSNGKSVFTETLHALAGEGNYGSIAADKVSDKTTALALVNKLYNVTEETSPKTFADTATFKTLTGGGEVQVKQLYKQEYAYRNSAKIVLVCNTLPRTQDMTHGLLRRLIIVPFDRRFSGKEIDRDLKKKLVAEASGIYNVLLNAYEETEKRGDFLIPDIARAAVEDYRKDNDLEGSFIRENVAIDPNGEVNLSELYAAYRAHCASQGVQERNMTTLDRLARKAHNIFPAAGRTRKMENGKRDSYMTGVALKMDMDI